ncbi:YIP1 family protein [Candidatus Gracilibacteria bacterium]|nr:YIP1 family protein [Candidatus Gracilibacteria bacterium]
MVVLLVGLLVGGVNAVQTLALALNPAREIAQQRSAITTSRTETASAFAEPDLRRIVSDVFALAEAQLAVYEQVVAQPALLPPLAGAISSMLRMFVATPLTYLAGLLITVAFTHLAARQLGGQGSLQQMLGLAALSVAPHALDALSFIGGIGPLISWVAWGWGLMVLIYATSIAHKIDAGRATLAVLLYPIVGFILAIIGFCLLTFFASALGAVLGGEFRIQESGVRSQESGVRIQKIAQPTPCCQVSGRSVPGLLTSDSGPLTSDFSPINSPKSLVMCSTSVCAISAATYCSKAASISPTSNPALSIERT